MDVASAGLVRAAVLVFLPEVYFALLDVVGARGKLVVSVAYVSLVYWKLA